MKQLLITLLILFSAFRISYSQEKKIKEALVPQSVLDGYKEKYKKLEVSNWLQDGEKYLAVFDKGESTFKASFTSDGKWLQSSTKVKEESVSGAVKKAIKNTEWKDWKISESYKVETPEYKKLFVLHMKKGKEKKILTFDPTGKAMDIK